MFIRIIFIELFWLNIRTFKSYFIIRIKVRSFVFFSLGVIARPHFKFGTMTLKQSEFPLSNSSYFFFKSPLRPLKKVTMFNLSMRLNTILSRKASFTEETFERFLSRMLSYVFPHIVIVIGMIITIETHIFVLKSIRTYYSFTWFCMS